MAHPTEQLPVPVRHPGRGLAVPEPGRCPYCDGDVRDHLPGCDWVLMKDQLLTVIESLAVTVCALQELHERATALEARLV
jgi:hypothetical protein